MGQLHTVNGRNFINGQVGLQKEEALGWLVFCVYCWKMCWRKAILWRILGFGGGGDDGGGVVMDQKKTGYL